MQTGARLMNEPEASPKSALKTHSPGSECPNGNHIAKMTVAPTAIKKVSVLIRP